MSDLLEGFWLNLDADRLRSAAMEKQLCELGLDHSYSRFRGDVGDPEHAAERGLRPGEEGAWRSWLAMLTRATSSSAEIVHLLEDDIVLTPDLSRLLQWHGLAQVLNQYHWLCTDAFVSPAQVRELLDAVRSGEGFVVVNRGFRVPCISSILARPQSLEILHDALCLLWEGAEPLLPIDVAMGQLATQGRLTFGSVIPFVTGPLLGLARVSNTRISGDIVLERSREALTMLRRLLLASPSGQSVIDEWYAFLNALDPAEQQNLIVDVVDGFVRRGVIAPY